MILIKIIALIALLIRESCMKKILKYALLCSLFPIIGLSGIEQYDNNDSVSHDPRYTFNTEIKVLFLKPSTNNLYFTAEAFPLNEALVWSVLFLLLVLMLHHINKSKVLYGSLKILWLINQPRKALLFTLVEAINKQYHRAQRICTTHDISFEQIWSRIVLIHNISPHSLKNITHRQ